MSNVTSLTEIKSVKISSDFQKQDVNFDIDKLRNACNEVLKIKGFDPKLINTEINLSLVNFSFKKKYPNIAKKIDDLEKQVKDLTKIPDKNRPIKKD